MLRWCFTQSRLLNDNVRNVLSQHKYRSKMFGYLGFTTPKVTWPPRRPASLRHSQYSTNNALKWFVFIIQAFLKINITQMKAVKLHKYWLISIMVRPDPTIHCSTKGGQQMWPFLLYQMLRKNEPFTAIQCFRKPYFPHHNRFTSVSLCNISKYLINADRASSIAVSKRLPHYNITSCYAQVWNVLPRPPDW